MSWRPGADSAVRASTGGGVPVPVFAGNTGTAPHGHGAQPTPMCQASTGQDTIVTTVVRHSAPRDGHIARAEHVSPGVGAMVSEGLSLGHHHHIVDHHQLVTVAVGAGHE